MGSKKKQLKQNLKPDSKTSKPPFSIFNSIENYLLPRADKIFFILLGLSVLTSIILFDMRVSVGGDDSTYIQRSYDFLKKGAFPFEQGPLYPLMLAPLIAMFGFNLFVLKTLSLICINLAFFITYKTFKNRIPYLLLFLLLGFIAFNPFYQYFASVTYTEAFFLVMQSLAIYYSLLLIDKSMESRLDYKTDWKILLVVVLVYLLVSLTKTVAIICTLPLFVYFFMNKKWDYLIGSFVAFIGLKLIYEVAIRAAYGQPDLGQFQGMFLVDLYKPQLGYEDLSGMIDRFITNANTYLSARFLSIVYLRDFNENYIVYKPTYTVVILILITASTILSYFKNKVVFFISLYAMSLIVAVFFGIQAKNTQYRLVIIIVPYLVLLLMYGFYYVSKNFVVLQVLFIGLFGYVVVASLFNATVKSANNFPILKENIKGNRYAGFTPDWVNYLKVSAWCADSLPKGEGIIARKHSMSFIYANGREFTPIYQVPMINDADSMIAFVKSYNCRYVILAQLRANPAKKDGQVVNTINVIMGRIHGKYPDKFKKLHSEGKDELAEVYEMLF
jgi:hypothetical protein